MGRKNQCREQNVKTLPPRILDEFSEFGHVYFEAVSVHMTEYLVSLKQGPPPLLFPKGQTSCMLPPMYEKHNFLPLARVKSKLPVQRNFCQSLLSSDVLSYNLFVHF